MIKWKVSLRFLIFELWLAIMVILAIKLMWPK